jgi:aconitate hydratase
MGVLPLQFLPGESVRSLGLTGRETLDFDGIAEAIASGFAAGREVAVRALAEDGKATEFRSLVRIDTPQEVLYYRHGGILQYVLRQLLGGREQPAAISRAPGAGVKKREYAGDEKVEEGSIESFPASDSPAY